MHCTFMMKNFLLYQIDPINYGDEIVDIKARIGNIENILNEVDIKARIGNIENILNEVLSLQKVSAKKPELELSLPGSSQPLDESILPDEDLESIFSGFCASSTPFQSPDVVSPPLPGPSSQGRSPFFPSQPFLRPRSLSVPPLLDGPSAGLMSSPPCGPTMPPSPMPTIPPRLMPTMPPMLPPSSMPPMPLELPHLSDDGQAQYTTSAASGSTFEPEPVEQVLQETQRFFTNKDIGRVAIALAKRCFFGEAALAAATLYGKGGKKQKLAGQKLTELRKALETIPLISTKTPTEKEQTWKQCLTAIANSCKDLRKKERKVSCSA